MDKYLLFVYPTIHPGGGWLDYKKAFRSLPCAQDMQIEILSFIDHKYNVYTWQIVDTETSRIVHEGGYYKEEFTGLEDWYHG